MVNANMSNNVPPDQFLMVEWFSCGKHYGLKWTGRAMCPQCQAEQEQFSQQLERRFDDRLEQIRREQLNG